MGSRFSLWLIVLCVSLSQETLSQGTANYSGKVIIFFSLDCPICQKYVQELNRISSRYSPNFKIEAVISEDFSERDLKEFITEYDVKFSIKIDKKNHLLDQYNPTVTPEIFLLNKSGTLTYQGAIDNWFYELGKYRQEPTEFYLIDALNRILEGKSPEMAKTEAIGCMISKRHKH